MRQSEKALRDAGWEETTYSDLDKGEEFYLLRTGALLVCKLGILDTEETVLRAPRPEPEYEAGTVARVRGDREEFNAICLPGGTDGLPSWNGKYSLDEVEVLRIIATPDGDIPMDDFDVDTVNRVEVIDDTGRAYSNTDAANVWFSFQDGGRTLKVFTDGTGYTPSYPAADSSVDALIEGMVPRVARAFQRGDHCRNCDWESEDEKWRAMYERVARRTIREAYEEATK